jgi:uncharacterized OB-fold protein
MSARWFPDDMPAPAVSRESLPWWQAAARHRLLVQACGACGRRQLPPGPMCRRCRAFDPGWHEVPGTGVIYTYTVVHRALIPSLAARLPYVVVVVDLDEGDGARLVSNLVGEETARPAVGMRVCVVWEDLGPGLAVPRFRPA